MDTTHPWPTRAQLQREAEAAHRQLDRERYLGKFEGLWHDIDLAIIGLEVIGEYDSAAKQAAKNLRETLEEAQWLVESNA